MVTRRAVRSGSSRKPTIRPATKACPTPRRELIPTVRYSSPNSDVARSRLVTIVMRASRPPTTAVGLTLHVVRWRGPSSTGLNQRCHDDWGGGRVHSGWSSSVLLWLVCLAVGAGDDDGVAVRVLDPDFAVSGSVALAFGWVSMRCSQDGSAELSRACHYAVEVADVAEPQQNAVADCTVRVADQPVMVFDLAVVQLKHQDAIGEKPFVLRAAVVAVQTEQLLIPAAGRFDIADRDHCL